jgi:small GTP-binding protein
MAQLAARRTFKFIVIGSSAVGKTALLRRLVDDIFPTEAQPTIGVEFLATSIDVEGQSVLLQIWDTAGQERFRSISKAYFRSALGVLLVFDLTDRSSFNDVETWIVDIHTLCDPNTIVTLVGNKLDLVESRKITVNEAETFAKDHQMGYIETSALGGDNVQEAFYNTAAAILRKDPSAGFGPAPPPTTPLRQSEVCRC